MRPYNSQMPERESSVALKLAGGEKQVGYVKQSSRQSKRNGKKYILKMYFNIFMNEAISHLFDQETKTAWLMNVAMIYYYFYFLHGIIWLAMFMSRSTKEIEDPECSTAQQTKYYNNAEQRLCDTSIDINRHRITHCLVFYESMVAGFVYRIISAPGLLPMAKPS